MISRSRCKTSVLQRLLSISRPLAASIYASRSICAAHSICPSGKKGARSYRILRSQIYRSPEGAISCNRRLHIDIEPSSAGSNDQKESCKSSVTFCTTRYRRTPRERCPCEKGPDASASGRSVYASWAGIIRWFRPSRARITVSRASSSRPSRSRKKPRNICSSSTLEWAS